MRRRAFSGFVYALVLILWCSIVEAHPLDELDPSIRSVQVVGNWKSGGDVGRYRIVERSGGVDRVVTEIFVQWVTTDNSPTRGARVLATRSLDDAGLPILSSVRWTIAATKLNALQLVVSGRTPDRGSVRYRFTLGTPGLIRR